MIQKVPALLTRSHPSPLKSPHGCHGCHDYIRSYGNHDAHASWKCLHHSPRFCALSFQESKTPSCEKAYALKKFSRDTGIWQNSARLWEKSMSLLSGILLALKEKIGECYHDRYSRMSPSTFGNELAL
jgi:hypothetical protein